MTCHKSESKFCSWHCVLCTVLKVRCCAQWIRLSLVILWTRYILHTHIHKHACTHARIHTHTHTNTHTHTHTHTHARMHARTHAHTHTHTHTQKSVFCPSQLDSHDKRFWRKLGGNEVEWPRKSQKFRNFSSRRCLQRCVLTCCRL